MKHLQPFQSRNVLALPVANTHGWRLKRYAILSRGRTLDDAIVSSALQALAKKLPTAGGIHDEDGNHGIGFQIIHFAEVAVVAPAFYWRWGSVLSSLEQMRAPWDRPTQFGASKNDVVGCVWEMDIVNFEVATWKTTVLSETGLPDERVLKYLSKQYHT